MDENKLNVYDEELKPCPFCGGEAKIVSRSTEVKAVNLGTTEIFSTDILEWCKVKCSECGCSTDRYSNVGGAIKWWNKRACSEIGLPTDKELTDRMNAIRDSEEKLSEKEKEFCKFKEYLCKREEKVRKQEFCMHENQADMESVVKSFDEHVLPKIDALKNKLDNFPY